MLHLHGSYVIIDEEQIIMQYTDNDILTALKRGERVGYEALVAHYGQTVFSFVLRMVGNEARAEELTQDTFIKMFETINRYDPQRASLATWLCRLAYRLVVDELRRRHKDPLYLPLYGEELENSMGAEAIDDYWIECMKHETMLNQLDEAVRQLPVEEQNLLAMYYYEHQSLNDIAFIVGVKDSTLRMRMSTIRKKLYEIMKQMSKYE